jgi:hypothetical protein
MATVKGVLKTVADAATADHTNASGGNGAILRVCQDTYEASTLVTGSLIEIGTKLPLGAVVYEAIVGYDALGSSTSISLGDAEDPDRYVTNTATTSAGIVRLNAVNGMNYTIDETAGTDSGNTDRQILATVVDSGSMTNTIRATVFWAN